MKTILNEDEMKRTLDRMAHEILERHIDTENLAVVGIKTRGSFLAKRLIGRIKTFKNKEVLSGDLGISFYRDDIGHRAEQPTIQSTEIKFDIAGKTIIIADDVLQTGRTVRCAIDELIDFGRPAKIELAVLVDRGHRELPISPDYVGKNIPTSRKEAVIVKMKELDGKDEVILENIEK